MAGRLVRTVRHLTPGQIFWRIRYRFPVREAAWRECVRRTGSHDWRAPILREVRVDPARGVATFLNCARPISSPSCWNDPGTPKLWLYHLHYFEDLGSQYRRDGSAAALAWLRRWIDENAPGKGNGWEPYPASRRVVSWIKAALDGLALDDAILRSLARQAARVESRLEFHLLANHLFVNAKALVYAGAFFDGRDANRCLAKGSELVLRQLDAQLLDDGGHFERSAMYHASFLEDILDLINLCSTYRAVPALGSLEPILRERAVAMLDWLVRMVCPDRTYPRFNDSTGAEAPTLDELVDYAARLDIAPSVAWPDALEHMCATGFARASADGWTVLADVGSTGPSCQPGHAHAGTLSVELYDHDRCLVCGSGVSTYEIGEAREFERSTMARWAVSVDGENSSEVWAGFRVGRRARVQDVRVAMEGETCVVEASHDGYRHLAGRPGVERHIEVGRAGVCVHDRVVGGGRHRASGRITLHPSVSSTVAGAGRATLRHRDGTAYELTVEPPIAIECELGWYAPEFGLRRRREVLAWRVDAQLPIDVKVRIRRC